MIPSAASRIRRRARSGPRDSERLRYVLMTTLLVTLRLGARPGPEPVLGNVRDAREDRLARIAATQATTADADAPRPDVTHAGDRLRELALSVPCDPGDADDLALADRERDVPHRGLAPIARHGQPLDLEREYVRELPRPLERPRHLDLTADHERGEGARRRARGGDRLDGAPAPEDRHAVGDGQHLVELVRDEDHGLALLGHRAERGEERDRLLRREHRGRLVHDQDPRLAVQRLQDLDALLLADRELPDHAHAGGRRARSARRAPRPALDRALVHEERATLRPVVSEHDVLGDGERLDQPEVLVHHADAGIERVAWRVEADRLAVELDVALVRPVEAGEDVRERRLPGAVLPEERVHLADRRPRRSRRRSRARRGSAS